MKDWKFHCAVLNVQEDADLKEVRKAFRKLALQLHPDKHQNSQKSKEDFQQLNESYRHIAAALIAGHRPESATAPSSQPQARAWEPKSESSSAPVVRKKFELKSQARVVPKSFRGVWLHAAVACFALLVLSLLVDKPVQNLPDYKPDPRELLTKNWCFISSLDGGNPVKEVAELWPQSTCEDRCRSLGTGRDVSCSWNSEEFRAFAVTPKPQDPLIASLDSASVPCEISVDRGGGPASTPYNGQTEVSCRTICEEMIKLRSRDGVRCTWKGAEFRAQARTILPLAATSLPPNYPQPPARQQFTVVDKQKVFPTLEDTLPEPSQGFRSTCFMSVVSEDGVTQNEFPSDTLKGCENRCMAEISTSPTGKEIRCAFAGRSVITYVPDPMVSYMSRDPSSSGIQAGADFMASCQIHARLGEKQAPMKSDVTTEKACAVACKADYLRRPRGAEVVCQFNGDTFFQKVVGQ